MNTNNFLSTSDIMENGTTKINNLMYSNYKTEKCENVDLGWCLNNKKWCCLMVGCEKKQPQKKVLKSELPKSGVKYVTYNRTTGKWQFRLQVNGADRLLKNDYDMNAVIEFRNKYIKERTINGTE